MKSVTHVITTIERGGAEKQLLILVEQQIAMGLEVSIVYLKGKPELEDDFRKLGVSNILDLSVKPLILQIFYLNKFVSKQSNVHAHLPRAELFSRLSLSRDCNLVISRHNSEPFFPKAPAFISSWLSRFVTRKASHVIAISKAVSDFLLKNKEVIDFNKVSVIYYGRASDINSYPGSIQESKVIGTVARLTEQKDYPTLMRAFKLFQNSRPDFRLQIVGIGNLESELKLLARELGIEESIDWIGKVSDPSEYMKNWNLFVLTSLYEGFGLVLLEAMSAGIPIVASDNSAIPEVLGEDFIGLAKTSNSHDFFSKFEELQDVPNREVALQQQKQSLLKFDSRFMAQKIEALYV